MKCEISFKNNPNTNFITFREKNCANNKNYTVTFDSIVDNISEKIISFGVAKQVYSKFAWTI